MQYINRTYWRTGTLWEGRYRSCLIRSETCVLACYRYIELNPVRACVVEHAADDAWSSYRFNGQGMKGALLSPHPRYTALGQLRVDCCRSYRELFRAHLEPGLIDEIRRATNGNYVLGDVLSSREIKAMLKRRASPGKAGRPVKGQ